MTPLMGWRLRADGERVEPVVVLAFIAPPSPINGEPIMAVYASTKTGRVGYDYADAFEVDVAPRPMVTPLPRLSLWERLVERMLPSAWGAHR